MGDILFEFFRMKSNNFVCSFCRSENSQKLYFLPCLNIFCNKCVASQIRSATDYKNKSTTKKAVTQEKELENNSEDARINIVKGGTRSFYSLARDDDSYETIAAEEFINEGCANNDEGYEIPNHNFYQNSSISTQEQDVVQLHLNGECFYEEVASKSIKKTKPLKADDEVFEEIHVKQLENLTENVVNSSPKPSFRRKSATFPISNDSQSCRPNLTDVPLSLKQEESQLQKCDRSEAFESLILNEMQNVRDDLAIHFKCPFCQDLHWMSEQGELLTQFPACPRNGSSISTGKRAEVVEFLSCLPENCCSKLCNNPNKSKYCIGCGKTLCESCVSYYHATHRTYEMEPLNSRYKSLVECYKASNEQRKRSCVDEVEKLQCDIGNLTSVKAKTIEILSKQKKLLMMELERIFKDKVNTLERNVGHEISQLEASLNQLNNQVTKVNRILEFSEAFLDQECSCTDKIDILLSIISSSPTLEQFKMPDRKEPINVCTEQCEADAGELSRMLGEVYFKRKAPGVLRSESTKEIKDSRSQMLSESIGRETSADPGKASSKSGGMKSIKGGVNRVSRIFKRSNFPPNKEARRAQKVGQRSGNPVNLAPSAIFNLQLTSDDEDCRLTDFFTSSGRHIVALDSNNHCLKLLNLGNDSLKVLPLDKVASVPLKVSVLEKNEELLVIVAEHGSNCIKLYGENGQELLRIGESYLLSVSSVATNSLKQIFAADTVHMRVFAYDCSGNMLFSFPRGSRHGKSKSPQCFVPLDIRTNPFNDDLVILDGARMSFLVFDRVGTYLFHLPVVAEFDDDVIVPNKIDYDGEIEKRKKEHKKDSEPKPISQHSSDATFGVTCDKSCSVIFDEEGCIYQRSSLGDKLVVYDCNGRLKSEIPVKIPVFNSSRLISVLDCHVRRTTSPEETDEISSEKSIILSSQLSTISIYKLASDVEESMSDSALTPTNKEVDGEMMSFKIIESRYADMTGKKQDVYTNLHPLDEAVTRSMQENIYSTINEQNKAAETKSKSNQRFSMRVKKIFKSKGSSNAFLTEVGDYCD